MDCKSKAYLYAGGVPCFLLQNVRAKDYILNPTILVNLRPTDPLQAIFAMFPEEDSPHMVSPATLATVIFAVRVWSPGKNTMVVLEVKYNSGSRVYSASVVQLFELRGQDEHEASTLGVTQYTFSAEQ